MAAYIVFMVLVVRCYLVELNVGSQIKVATLFGVAAADLGTDVAYVWTQPYASLLLFGGSCAFVLAPSLAYLWVSGTFGTFLRSLPPFYADVWFSIYCLNRWSRRQLRNLVRKAGNFFLSHLFGCLCLIVLYGAVFPCIILLFLSISLLAPVVMISVYLLSINLKLPIFNQVPRF